MNTACQKSWNNNVGFQGRIHQSLLLGTMLVYVKRRKKIGGGGGASDLYDICLNKQHCSGGRGKGEGSVQK